MLNRHGLASQWPETTRYGMDRNCENIASITWRTVCHSIPASAGERDGKEASQVQILVADHGRRFYPLALQTKLAQTKPDDPEGRTFAEIVVSNLVELACSQNRNSVAAACEIFNRCEGKVTQGLTIADVTADLQSKTDGELLFFLENGSWPEDDTAPPPASEKAKSNTN